MTLPSGTVTLLFTDIEGSTQLLHRLGDRYGDALTEHRRLLRNAFASHEGHEVDTQGDAFFVAFPRASPAIAAAAAAQRSLASATWPDGSVLKVRMGIHTGHPAVIGEGYVGIDVHKGARICSSSHGGQVVVSEETAGALATEIDDPPLRDLGEHRLKDLTAPERLYQLVVEGLPQDFAPLRSISPSNLPQDVSSLIGRARELDEITSLLDRTDVRHLTLTGTGGTGKTRLALAIAHGAAERAAYSSGVFFVPLAAITDHLLVPSALAKALGVTGSAEQPIIDSIKAYVAGRQILIVLDNFEQVLDAAHIVTELLTAGPKVTLLVTSRTSLRTMGEHEFPVPPLSLPDRAASHDVAALSRFEAVELFVARAQAVDPAFTLTAENAEAVGRICARLDGLPLAIELAAARIRLFDPAALAMRLERRLELLSAGPRDAPERQRSLRSTLEWSHNLLGRDEQTLFAHLAVFSGGFTTEAVSTVSGTDSPAVQEHLEALERLLEANLIQRDFKTEDESRFFLLETVREYALERLDHASYKNDVRTKHAEYYAQLAEQAEPALRSRHQDHWLGVLDREHDNCRAALTYTIAEAPTIAMRLAASLVWFWDIRGHVTEGLAWLSAVRDRALATNVDTDPWVLFEIARLAIQRGELDGVEQLLEESLSRFTERGDARGRVEALTHLGWALEGRGDWTGSIALHEKALEVARAADDEWALGAATSNLGGTLMNSDLALGRELAEKALPIRRRVGDKYGLAITLNSLGYFALAEGDFERAKPLLEECLAIAREMGSLTMISYVLGNLSYVDLERGDVETARAMFDESMRLARDLGMKAVITENLAGIASIAARQEMLELAATLAGASARLHDESNDAIYGPEQHAIDSLRSARAALGEDAWALAFERGRNMAFEDAIARALEVGPPPHDG